MILGAYLIAVHAEHLRLGFRSGGCDACVPRGWHDDARAGRLRTAVIGGIPIDSDPTRHRDTPLGARREAAPGAPSRSLRDAAMATQPV